eukprot:COSAG01_NODE_2791_length_7069_cov_11.407174_11_plen_79_part_00
MIVNLTDMLCLCDGRVTRIAAAAAAAAASMDGDADRLVYFYVTEGGAMQLLDGDKIATLFTVSDAAAFRRRADVSAPN